MVEVLERDTVGETIDATVNYVVNNGEKLFTETAGPGGTDVRTGGTVDPHRVPIHNARLHSDPFVLDREGFRFVRHDTAVADFFASSAMSISTSTSLSAEHIVAVEHGRMVARPTGVPMFEKNARSPETCH